MLVAAIYGSLSDVPLILISNFISRDSRVHFHFVKSVRSYNKLDSFKLSQNHCTVSFVISDPTITKSSKFGVTKPSVKIKRGMIVLFSPLWHEIDGKIPSDSQL